jgi:hypothetical protein
MIILGSRARPVHKADNLTAICEPIVYTNYISHPYASTACYRDSFTFLTFWSIFWGEMICVVINNNNKNMNLIKLFLDE